MDCGWLYNCDLWLDYVGRHYWHPESYCLGMQILNLAENSSFQDWMRLVQTGYCEHQTFTSLTSCGRHYPARRHIFFFQAGVVWQGLLNLRQLIKYSARLIVLMRAVGCDWDSASFVVPQCWPLFAIPLNGCPGQPSVRKNNFCMIF